MSVTPLALAGIDTPTLISSDASTPAVAVNTTERRSVETVTLTPTIAPTFRQLAATLLFDATAATMIAATPAHNADWHPYSKLIDGVEMVLVPPGCFMMGSTIGEPDEQPVEQQCVETAFWIDQNEVSNSVFDQFGGAARQSAVWSESDLPRTNVTWYEAETFCEKRNARLPTEKEWEYVAAGPDSAIYPWGNTFSDLNAVYAGNSGEQPAPVGSHPSGKSWVGAYDMSGNVWEWTSSLDKEYPYQTNDSRDRPRCLAGGLLVGGLDFNSLR